MHVYVHTEKERVCECVYESVSNLHLGLGDYFGQADDCNCISSHLIIASHVGSDLISKAKRIDWPSLFPLTNRSKNSLLPESKMAVKIL